MIIIGAGMAGLIAANYFRKRSPEIMEKQAQLPDNHGALLRFRTDKVFRVAGLSATRVTVRKCIVFGEDFMSGPNPYLANMYSEKVTGQIQDRSIWSMATEDRYIAPPDFLPRLADGCQINFGSQAGNIDIRGFLNPCISTMPMPVLMKGLGWKDIPEFHFKPIWTITADLPGVDINQTIYFPEMDVPYYRASFVGSRFIIELVRDPGDEAENLATEVLDYFGFLKPMEITVKHQPLGKMLPINNELRKEFMHYATSTYNIYSLGRFATWRPILLDDVVDDLAVIERMMASSYEALRLKYPAL